jgi:apolipoprotein N-acyltransferase
VVLRRAALAVLAGVAQLAAFPPLGWWWAAPIGVAALLAACRGTLWSAWRYAALTYLVLFLPLLEWIRFLGLAPWLLLCVLQAAIAALLGPLMASALRDNGRSQLLRGLTIVGAVVAVEALRSRVPFGGLTWRRLAFGQSEGPLLGWAGLGGAPLVTAMTAASGVGLYALLRRTTVRPDALGALAATATLCGPGVIALGVDRPGDGRPVTVAAVQGNVPGDGLDAFAEDLVVLDNHLRQTEKLAADVDAGRRPPPQLVIWPENVADQDPRTEPQTRARLDAAVDRLGKPLLLGALLDDPGRRRNALLI